MRINKWAMESELFVRMSPQAAAPKRISSDSACWDLRALGAHRLRPSERCPVPTGCGVRLPDGYVAVVCTRSGVATNRRITVISPPGVISPDHDGEIEVVLINYSSQPVDIAPGERVAQLMLLPLGSFFGRARYLARKG